MSQIERVSVIGSGAMGHQIALLMALGGYQTTVQDIDDQALARAEAAVEKLLHERMQKGKIGVEEKNAVLERLSFTPDLARAVESTDLVVEAVVEKLDVKRALFAKLDQLSPSHTILATNSSTIVNSKLADVTNRPDKVINMHFFYPPLVMDLVEVVMSAETSEETAQTVLEVCQRIGRTGVLLRKEISGFVANRILGAIVREAIHLYEQGVADYREIDLVVTKALRHPLGPFQLMDLSGIDVIHLVMQQQYAESNNPKDRPPDFLADKVARGELGRKTGIGFYDYRQIER